MTLGSTIDNYLELIDVISQLCSVQMFTIASYLELCAVLLSRINYYLELIDLLPQLSSVQLSTIDNYLELTDVLP